jgi:hypothetical protein
MCAASVLFDRNPPGITETVETVADARPSQPSDDDLPPPGGGGPAPARPTTVDSVDDTP